MDVRCGIADELWEAHATLYLEWLYVRSDRGVHLRGFYPEARIIELDCKFFAMHTIAPERVIGDSGG
jgi:hypothetical protein